MVIISNDFEQKIKMLHAFFSKNATYFLVGQFIASCAVSDISPIVKLFFLVVPGKLL